MWGYALDEVWPLPDLSIHDVNIVTSPHIGSDSLQGKAAMQRMSALAVAAFVNGKMPPHVINPVSRT